MKAILPLTMVAALGVAAAGCGSAAKTSSGPITITGTTTLSHVETGMPIRCTRGVGASVPPPGQAVAGIGDPVVGSSAGGQIQLKTRHDGTVVAVCRRY
jgi:hypothetical protein